MRRYGGRAVAGLAVTVLLLWWVLRDVDLAMVLSEVRGADYLLLTVAVAVATATFLLRALRWKVLLHPLRAGIGLRSRFAAVSIGFMANNLLPARVGEFVRAYALSRMEPVAASAAFGSLVVERFLDGLAILLLMGVAILAPGFPADAAVGGRPVGGVVQTVALLLVGVLALFVLLLLRPRQVIRGAEGVARLLPGNLGKRVVDALEAFLQGFEVLRSPRLMVLAVLWSLAVWAWQSLSFWIGFRAFGIEVGYDAALFVNAIVAFAVAVPSAPGFFGTFHAGVVVALVGVYGVGRGETLAFAFGYHLGGFIPVTVIGLYYAWRLGLSLAEVEASEKVVEEEGKSTLMEEGGSRPGSSGKGGPHQERER